MTSGSAPANGSPKMAKILFITGTDTGVGKTVLTALLVRYLRQRGCHALACQTLFENSIVR
jgi:uncharacterized NAD-dependent epimerase/dehydratase family protein